MPNDIQKIHKKIFQWYQKYQRIHLPWRHTRDPYKILVSEVMLQQTQVDRVIPKYREFLALFPTVKKLAKAKTADVIRAWKGLGYNRRALFLQKTAQAIVAEHHGKFPKDLDALKKLPGIGDYTARAILSFAFEESVPVLDTNHRRFYQRVFFGMREKRDKTLLKKAECVVRLSPCESVYDWNQTLMDFGSLVCTTKQPKCLECPIQKWCRAYPSIGLRTSAIRLQQKRQRLKSEVRKPKSVPFKDTDRYVRGRIIDALREKNGISTHAMRKRFPHIADERYARILSQLEKDGLLVLQRGSILLPV